MAFLRQLLPDYSLNGRFSLFSGPYPQCGLDRNDENLAIPVLARFRRGDDQVHDSARVAVANDNLDLYLWQERRAKIHSSEVRCGLSGARNPSPP